MSISNSKFRSTREAPTEPLKRSVASCLKAIAKAPELDVSFAAERPGLAPGKARLPEPARKMTKRDAAIVRGHADSIALKLDRKSTRLNSSHLVISYAVFCLKKKNNHSISTPYSFALFFPCSLPLDH